MKAFPNRDKSFRKENRASKSHFSTFFAALIIIIFAIILLIVSELWRFTHNSKGLSAQTQITIFNSFGTYSKKNLALSELINKYTESHSDIDISSETVSSDMFYLKLNSDFSADCTADIIIAPPCHDTEMLYKRGYLANLGKEIQNDADGILRFDKSILKFSSCNYDSNGSVYGLPFDAQYIVLYLNTDLFKRNNIKIPDTYSDFKAAISQFAAKGITPVAFGANDDNMYLYQILCSVFSGTDSEISNSAGIGSYIIPAATELKALYNLGAFPFDYSSLTLSDARRIFTEGKAAMIVDSSEFSNELIQYANSGNVDYTSYISKIDVCSFPMDGGFEKSNFSVVAYNAGEFTVFINKKSYKEKHDEIMDFIRYLCTPDALRLYLAHTSDIITVKSLNSRNNINPFITKSILAVENATKATAIAENSVYKDIWMSRMCKKIPDFLKGTESIEEIADNIANLTYMTEYQRRDDEK